MTTYQQFPYRVGLSVLVPDTLRCRLIEELVVGVQRAAIGMFVAPAAVVHDDPFRRELRDAAVEWETFLERSDGDDAARTALQVLLGGRGLSGGGYFAQGEEDWFATSTDTTEINWHVAVFGGAAQFGYMSISVKDVALPLRCVRD